jgi:hypothetical protein
MAEPPTTEPSQPEPAPRESAPPGEPRTSTEPVTSAPAPGAAPRIAAGDDDHANPFSPFALVVLLVLVGGGLWLVFALKDMAAVQDCAWSGRHNCAPIDPQAPVPLSK